MTTPGERFKNWIDSLGTEWSARLGGWLGTAIGAGIDAFMKILGKSFSKKLTPVIEELTKTGEIPPWLKPILDEILNPTGEAAALLGGSMGGNIVGGLIDRLLNPILLPMARAVNVANPQVHIGADLVLRYMRRHPDFVTEGSLRLKAEGFRDLEQALMWELMEARFPSGVVGPAWLRDKAKYEKYWDDVYEVMGIEKKEGKENERIALLKEMTYRIPSAQDVIRYAVKEAYSPKIYEAFGQHLEFPELAMEDAEAAGVRRDYLEKEWRAHWNLPGVSQGFDLMHRREITQGELSNLLKSLDIMPYWRDKLTALSWNVPNRIELRLMARYGLVEKKFLMEVLEFNGTDPRYREVIADMMLAQGLMTDLPVRYRNKWINSDEVKAELAQAGLSQDVQDRIYKWIVKNAGPERTAAEKDLTAAEIIKGVKKQFLTWDEAVQQLIALGYDEAEANFKLAIDVEVVETVPTAELNTRVDTIRRRRRARFITRDDETSSFLDLGLDIGLATAYADNDDLRLIKATMEET